MYDPSHRPHLLTLASCIALTTFACKEPASTAPLESRLLGSAADFLVLGASTVTNTGPTLIDGDLGLSPGSSLTGFPPGLATGSTHVADGAAAQAQIDLIDAGTVLQNTPCDVTLTNAELGGLTLTPGVYCFTSSSVGLTGQLTLDAEGRRDATFAFLIASTLTTASGSSVIVTNGASDCNVYWQVGSSATLGTNSSIIGSVLALASITATTGATVSGRLLAHTGAVTLEGNTVTLACNVGAPPPIDAGTPPPIDAGTPPPIDAGTPPPIDAGPSALVCGDARVDAGELCDDGNTTDGDGCSAVCTIELPPPPPAVCGDGIVGLGEQCDDGNTNNFDACSNQCIVGT